jgi:hypothetical protein
MIVTSTGVVSSKSRRESTGGSSGSGAPYDLLVRFTDPQTWRQKTQRIKCTESQFDRFTVGDVIGLQRNGAWWAFWEGWHIAV